VRLVDVKLTKGVRVKVKQCIDNDKKMREQMRKHPFGQDNVCVGRKKDDFCDSLLTNLSLKIEEKDRELLNGLENLRLAILKLQFISQGGVTENIVQTLLESMFQIIANLCEPKVKIRVYDIRNNPSLYIKEDNVFYVGKGDLLVVIRYECPGGKSLVIAAIAIEAKLELTGLHQIGQLTGQMLHFNGRQTHGRPYVVTGKSTFTQNCYGLLTNSEGSVVVTGLGKLDNQYHHLLEVINGSSTPVCDVFYVVLKRAVEVMNIITGKELPSPFSICKFSKTQDSASAETKESEQEETTEDETEGAIGESIATDYNKKGKDSDGGDEGDEGDEGSYGRSRGGHSEGHSRARGKCSKTSRSRGGNGGKNSSGGGRKVSEGEQEDRASELRGKSQKGSFTGRKTVQSKRFRHRRKKALSNLSNVFLTKDRKMPQEQLEVECSDEEEYFEGSAPSLLHHLPKSFDVQNWKTSVPVPFVPYHDPPSDPPTSNPQLQ